MAEILVRHLLEASAARAVVRGGPRPHALGVVSADGGVGHAVIGLVIWGGTCRQQPEPPLPPQRPPSLPQHPPWEQDSSSEPSPQSSKKLQRRLALMHFLFSHRNSFLSWLQLLGLAVGDSAGAGAAAVTLHVPGHPAPREPPPTGRRQRRKGPGRDPGRPRPPPGFGKERAKRTPSPGLSPRLCEERPGGGGHPLPRPHRAQRRARGQPHSPQSFSSVLSPQLSMPSHCRPIHRHTRSFLQRNGLLGGHWNFTAPANRNKR